MNKLIWQPSLTNRYDFVIYLDFGFALEMIRTQIPAERQRRLNEIANDEIKQMGNNWRDPYTFHKSSCFISQVYIGNNGVWLSSNHQEIDRLLRGRESKPIEYYSHNVDSSKEAYILMALFDRWISLSDALKSA